MPERPGFVKPFVERLAAASRANRSLICVGLDPDPARMPVPDVFQFNRAIVDATRDLVCAYKPNLAFYEALGPDGLGALKRTLEYVRREAPGMVVIGDAKRGDIPSSSAMYAKALFEVWGFDAATVNCYGGGESLEPFLQWRDRGVFVWCRSSNPGAGEFQDLPVSAGDGGASLYQWVARRALGWNAAGNVGLVLGATYPEEIGHVRAICPDMPLLVPAVGAQGGRLAQTVSKGVDAHGRAVIISAARSIIYASNDSSRFAEASREAAQSLRAEVNRILDSEGKGW